MKVFKILLAAIAIPALFAASAQACGDKKGGSSDKKETSVLMQGAGCGGCKGDSDKKKDA